MQGRNRANTYSVKCNERALFILCIIIYQSKVRRASRLIDVLWKIKFDWKNEKKKNAKKKIT